MFARLALTAILVIGWASAQRGGGGVGGGMDGDARAPGEAGMGMAGGMLGRQPEPAAGFQTLARLEPGRRRGVFNIGGQLLRNGVGSRHHAAAPPLDGTRPNFDNALGKRCSKSSRTTSSGRTAMRAIGTVAGSELM